MPHLSELIERRPRLPLPLKWWAFFAFCAVAVGCRTTTVFSDCPAPNIEERDDLEEFLCPDHNHDGACDTPDRPAKAWVSRVLGQIYDVELRDVRGQ